MSWTTVPDVTGKRDRAVALARVLVALLVLVVLVWGVARNWSEISADLGRASVGALVLATALAALGTWLTMLGWRVLLQDLGSPVHVAPASGVFFVGQLGKYLPGSVWAVLVQADIAAKLGIPRRRTAVVGLVALGISWLTGFVVGMPALPLLLRSLGSEAPWWLSLLAIPLAVLLCWPALLNRLVATILRVLRRDPLERELSTSAVLTSAGIYVLVWLVFGLHALVLARSIGGVDPAGLTVAAIAGYPLAGSLGMIAVMLPAGLGARDGVLTLVLATALSVSAGAAVALLSRFLVTLVDVLAALAGWGYARTHALLGSRAGAR